MTCVVEYMTFVEFLSRARERYGVRVDDFQSNVGVPAAFLVRPIPGDDPLWTECPNLRPTDRIPAEVIARVCRALNMKPHDFGLLTA